MPPGRPRNPRTPASALERMVFEIGQRLGEALLQGVQSRVGKTPRAAPAGRRGPGRPPRAVASGSGCVVPNCARRAVAKGLCATHYRKARRLNMGDELSTSQLAELSQDGRKTRFQNKAA